MSGYVSNTTLARDDEIARIGARGRAKGGPMGGSFTIRGQGLRQHIIRVVTFILIHDLMSS